MSIFKRFIEFFVYSNIFITMVALVMAEYTFRVFNASVSSDLLLFILFGTLSSYAFHWYLSSNELEKGNRLKWNAGHKQILIIVFLLSLPCCIFFFFQLGNVRYWAILGGTATFIYSAPKINRVPFIWLRKVAVGKTVYLSGVWVFSTVVLPLVVCNRQFSYEGILFTLNRFLLVFPICVLFDRKDRESDLGQGIRNIIYELTSMQVGILNGVCLSLFFVSGFLFLDEEYILTPKALFLLLPGGLFALLSPMHRRKPNDLYYYFVLDGLMMLSGLACIAWESIIH